MKTILLGKVPPPTKPWWIGLHVTCGYCATVVELEPADDVIRRINTCLNIQAVEKSVFYILCPVCNVTIEFLEPTA